MDDFNTIRLKKKTIEKFKEYSKKVSPNYSETLDYMIAFFEDNYLSPYDTLNGPMWSFNKIINKRMDAVVAIIRNMEKTQLIPSREMLETLFDEADKEDEQELLEEVLSDGISEELFTEQKELEYYRKGYFTGKSSLREVKDEFNKVLNKVDYIKNNFGKNYYRLTITQQEFEEILLNINNK